MAENKDPEIKIDDLESDLREEKFEKDVCIFRAPHLLKKIKEDAYIPEVVGLGPYHHWHGNLHDLREHKLEAVRRNLSRMFPSCSLTQGLHLLRKFVDDLKQQILSCYEEQFVFSEDLFILDTCFLIEVCLCHSLSSSLTAYAHNPDNPELLSEYTNGGYHPIFNETRMHSVYGVSILSDLVKLENQLPLVLVRKLIEMQEFNEDLLLVVLLHAIPFTGKQVEDRASKILQDDKNPPRHILEWAQRVMMLYISRDTTVQREQIISHDKVLSSLPRVRDLQKVGIDFEAANNLSFEEKHINTKGILHLPKMSINHSVEVALRNIVAYEQCLVPNKRVVTAFVVFMGCLIDKEDDVAILMKRGIIENLLQTNGAVADLINNLCVNVPTGMVDGIDENISQKIREYYKSSWRVITQEFLHTHFSRPWYICATIFAIVQAIYAMRQLN